MRGQRSEHSRAPLCCLWRPSVQGLPPRPGERRGGGGTLEEAEGRRAEGATGLGGHPQTSKFIRRKLSPGVPSPCLHPLLPRLGARRGQEAPRDPAPHHGRSDRWGPSRPVGEEGRSHDPQTLSPWGPLGTQPLPDPSAAPPRDPTLTGTPFSPAAPGGPCGPGRPGGPMGPPDPAEPRSPGDPCDRSERQTL